VASLANLVAASLATFVFASLATLSRITHKVLQTGITQKNNYLACLKGVMA
jgi:hypothetical protein